MGRFDHEMRYEGKCSTCGKPVIRIVNSEKPTRRRSGERYIYPNRPDNGYDIYSCDGCYSTIDRVWVPKDLELG